MGQRWWLSRHMNAHLYLFLSCCILRVLFSPPVNDAEDVKAHPFFEGIDWKKLERLEIPAPFKPSVTEGTLDTTNVDEEFKRETPKDTPVTQSTLAAVGGVQFPGFSFQAPDSNLAAQPSLLQDTE